MVLLLVALAYVCVTWLTTWAFIGDAPDYAHSAVAQFSDGDCAFLEFGHVMWRPMGYALLNVATGGHRPASDDSGWLLALSLMNRGAWVFGLITVLALTVWLRDLSVSIAGILVGALFVLVTSRS